MQVASGAQAVVAGNLHSLMLKQDGTVWATGRNSNGQFGDGSTSDSPGLKLSFGLPAEVLYSQDPTAPLRGDPDK